MNFFSFCGSFLPSWIRMRILIPKTDPDPDPLARFNTVENFMVLAINKSHIDTVSGHEGGDI